MSNPNQQEKNYDLIAIGSGEAGTTAVQRCSQAGWKTAVIDKQPFGGTCALRGCNPKQAMVNIAQTVERLGNLEGHGITYGSHMDWHSLMNFKEHMINGLPERTIKNLEKQGIDCYQGQAKLTGPQTVEVKGQALNSRYILLATGAVPRPLEIPGENFLMTTDELLNLESLPQKIVFVGGGYIAFEFAHILRRAGVQVVILEQSERVLAAFDHNTTNMIVKVSQDIGIAIHCDAPVTRISREEETITVETGGQDKQRYTCQVAVHAAGRVPDFTGLNLEAAGVDMHHHKLVLTDSLQSTSNPHVMAAGDAAGQGYQLTPVAEMESRLVAENLLTNQHNKPDYRNIPMIAATIPSMGGIGLKEDDLSDEDKKNIAVITVNASKRHQTTRLGARHALYKMLVDKKTKQLLGVHLVGSQIQDTMNFFALAVSQQLTLQQCRSMVWTFPSLGYDIILALDQHS